MANNLLELLDTWAAHKPYQTGYRFLPRGPGEATTISYQQLTERICDVASRLRQTAEPGSRVLVAATSTIDFVLTLLGTLWAGMIAVPLSPSYFLGRRKGLAQIVANCEPSIAVSPYPRLSPTALDLISGTTLLQTSDLVSRGAAKRSSLSWRPDERLAILQYTSGSTAAPRGVRITHANILSNAWSMAQLYRLGPETVGVNWTPLYHDMGLMAGVFVPLVCGYESILLSPESVVAEPLRWLAAISEHGGTISGGPNFAYDLCLERIDDAASHGLQLRSWMVAFTGAENVRAETLNRFADRFSKWGFRRQAFYPCYRLAEATVFVCGKSLGSGSDVIEVDRESLQLSGIAEPAVLARPAVRLVNHGEPPADTEVVIVDPKRLTCCSEGQIGEI